MERKENSGYLKNQKNENINTYYQISGGKMKWKEKKTAAI